MHVLIIGGGIGGLSLAQGLKKAGVSVEVFERDRTRTDRLQGYRISIRGFGTQALEECLSPDLFRTFKDTTGEPGTGIRFVDENINELLFLQGSKSEVENAYSVSRITLRQVLLHGLDDVLHFNKVFSHYEETADGKVVAHFDDGSTASGDVLVGADGSRSKVRKQLLPDADPLDSGILGIGGKVPLTDALKEYLPKQWYDGPVMILSSAGHGMFSVLQRFRNREEAQNVAGIGGNDEAIKSHAGLLFDNTADYLMFGFLARRESYNFPEDPRSLDPEELRKKVLDKTPEFHPILRRFIAEADASTMSIINLRSAPVIPHWKTGRVTVMGDAIHCMCPTGGVGANTAIKDASTLCREILAATKGEKDIVQALNDYEVEMMRYGFVAVKDSLRNANIGVTSSWLKHNLVRNGMRMVNGVMAVRRALGYV